MLPGCAVSTFQNIHQMLWFICCEKLDSLWRLSVSSIRGYVCKWFSKRLKMRIEANIFPGLFVAGCRWDEMTRFRTALLLSVLLLPSVSWCLENTDWGGKNNSWCTFFYLRWRGFYLFVSPQCLWPHHKPRPLCEHTDWLQTRIPAFWGSCWNWRPCQRQRKAKCHDLIYIWSCRQCSLKPRMSAGTFAFPKWSETFRGNWDRCSWHKHGFNLCEPICGSMMCDEKESLVFRKNFWIYFSASPSLSQSFHLSP